MSRFAASAAMATLLISATVSAQPSPTGATGELAARLLAVHNHERALVGAPPLQWDATLAAHAASYGPVLASLRRLVHSPREGRPTERENLARAWHGTMSPEDMVGMWTNERQMLVPRSYLFPGTSRTGNWEDIGHYTQMVWPTTTHVGCAIYSCRITALHAHGTIAVMRRGVYGTSTAAPRTLPLRSASRAAFASASW